MAAPNPLPLQCGERSQQWFVLRFAVLLSRAMVALSKAQVHEVYGVLAAGEINMYQTKRALDRAKHVSEHDPDVMTYDIL